MEIVSSNDILQVALRPSTILTYKTYKTKRTITACKIMYLTYSLDYFTHLYNSGASYNVLNSSKSALSHIVFLSIYSFILEHPKIIKYFKGVYILRPPSQKITLVWDVKILVDYFSGKGENDQISDKSFIQKLLILLLLLAGQKISPVYFFTVDRMIVTDLGVTFSPIHVLKHSKPGKKLDSFHYRAYHNKTLCVVDCLKKYLKRCNAKEQTDTKALFITYGKPFRAAATGSISGWLKELFIETSILKEYTRRTCRSAATSKASQLNVDIAKILKQGCW